MKWTQTLHFSDFSTQSYEFSKFIFKNERILNFPVKMTVHAPDRRKIPKNVNKISKMVKIGIQALNPCLFGSVKQNLQPMYKIHEQMDQTDLKMHGHVT